MLNKNLDIAQLLRTAAASEDFPGWNDALHRRVQSVLDQCSALSDDDLLQVAGGVKKESLSDASRKPEEL